MGKLSRDGTKRNCITKNAYYIQLLSYYVVGFFIFFLYYSAVHKTLETIANVKQSTIFNACIQLYNCASLENCVLAYFIIFRRRRVPRLPAPPPDRRTFLNIRRSTAVDIIILIESSILLVFLLLANVLWSRVSEYDFDCYSNIKPTIVSGR